MGWFMIDGVRSAWKRIEAQVVHHPFEGPTESNSVNPTWPFFAVLREID